MPETRSNESFLSLLIRDDEFEFKATRGVVPVKTSSFVSSSMKIVTKLFTCDMKSYFLMFR